MVRKLVSDRALKLIKGMSDEELSTLADIVVNYYDTYSDEKRFPREDFEGLDRELSLCEEIMTHL